VLTLGTCCLQWCGVQVTSTSQLNIADKSMRYLVCRGQCAKRHAYTEPVDLALHKSAKMSQQSEAELEV